jgi:putative aminopeptidase FrvX
VDTLGAMVKEIKENGRLALTRIGGYGWFSIDGVYCQVETLEGKRISGTILHKKSSVHVYEDAGKNPSQETIEVRLDAKVKSREDVERLGIRVGDFVSFAPNVEITETGFIKSRHLDDKACAAILLELVFALQKERITLPHTTHILFSTYEEVGFGANSNIPPNVREFLAVDMAAIGDGQASDEYSVTICAMDRSGPYDFLLRKKLVQLAEQNGISYHIDLYPHYASDASAARLAGYDVICGLIGPGVDASHAYERTHRDALENTYLLLYHYLMSEC